MPPPSSNCDLFNLKDMHNGSYCFHQWRSVRTILHPAQQAVGYVAVKRKIDKGYQTHDKAQERMESPSSLLPFVLGPGNVPFLVDSHHTVSALEASGFDTVKVTLKKICDWSHMGDDQFHRQMKDHNFMNGVGRLENDTGNVLPVPVQVSQAIPPVVPFLQDDPWRSLAAMVRKVKDKKDCPKDNKKCLRGYLRKCEGNGRMTPFFEFRWAYFLNEAYLKGCDGATSYWDDASDCRKFERTYNDLMAKNNTDSGDFTKSIMEQDHKAWQKAAKLLVPLCRSKAAQTYILPDSLGRPMGGEPLPGRVEGKDTHIVQEDPKCAAPKCPVLPPPPDGSKVDTIGVCRDS